MMKIKSPEELVLTAHRNCNHCAKVGVPISVRVLKLTPRVRSTYLGAFTVHSTAIMSLAANGRF